LGSIFRVLYQDTLAGILESDDEGRLSFQYFPEWIDSHSSFPISASLPLAGGWTPGVEDHRWFANLLPEGGARESLCRIYGISVSNDAVLSGKIGAECAGALRILPEIPEDTDDSEKDGYRDIAFENLKEITAGSCSMSSPGTLMAMSSGRQREAGQIRRSDWEDMAADMSVHPRLIFREIDRIKTTLAEGLETAVSEFLIDGWNEAPIIRVRSVIEKRLRRIRRNL